MNRYAVFAFDEYYPGGGWNDYRGSFEDADEAVKYALPLAGSFDYTQVVDTHLGIVIWDHNNRSK